MGTVVESGLGWRVLRLLSQQKAAALQPPRAPGSEENKAPSLCRLPRDPPNDSEDERRRAAAGPRSSKESSAAGFASEATKMGDAAAPLAEALQSAAAWAGQATTNLGRPPTSPCSVSYTHLTLPTKA